MSVGYQDIDNEEEIINKADQRGRAMSYKHEIPRWITKFNSIDTIE